MIGCEARRSPQGTSASDGSAIADRLRQFRLQRVECNIAKECAPNWIKSKIGQQESTAHTMTNTQPEEGEREEEQTQSMSQVAAAANNNNNTQRLNNIVVNQEPESAVFLSMATPEVLGMAGQFPVGRGITWGGMNHPPQWQSESRHSRQYLQPLQAGKFPLHHALRENRSFPLDVWENVRFPLDVVKVYTTTSQGQAIMTAQLAKPHQVYATSPTVSFPLHQVYAPLDPSFPHMIQLGYRRNSGEAVPHISITMTRRNPSMASSPAGSMAAQEFPIIKKQFVSFPNYRMALAKEEAPTRATVTQRGSGAHKVFDNELGARRRRAWAATTAMAALNLNVVEAAVAKEIEHQQAENLNDAFGFGQRHDHKGRVRVSDDAMDVDVDGAKNKREICEQSKLEKAEDHNELNMTENEADQEQQQSICLAREQTIDGNGNGDGDGNHQQSQLSGDLSASDARESSPEQDQVDVNNLGRQQLTRERNRYQNRYRNPCPNIELLKSSVRAFLADSSPIDWDWACDWELLDLLTDAIELLCAAPADTGNLWSEEAVQAGADMTISKVSEERETETVDVAIEQLDQPPELELESELDANNNQSPSAIITDPLDMKYATSTASRIARTETPQPVIAPSIRPSPTSRIRDVASVPATSRIRDVAPVPVTVRTPLLGELKRSSTEASSIDTDSVLPERTRLRRQRRMRSQDSVEEKPEDVIERINKLKARISGALSEVKGVLKQYSTESEAESGPQEAPLPRPSSVEGGASEPAPVAFRFVKKVRRRSYFDEAEEEKEQAEAQVEGGQPGMSPKDRESQSNQGFLSAPQKDKKVMREQTPFAFPEKEDSSLENNRETKETESLNRSEKHLKAKPEQVGIQELKGNRELVTTVDGLMKSKEAKEPNKDSKESKELSKDSKETKEPNKSSTKSLEETIQEKYPRKDEKVEEATSKSNLKEVPEEPPKINGELTKTDQSKVLEKSKSQTKIEFLAKVQSELKSKSVREASRREGISKERTPEGTAAKEVATKEATHREASPKEATIKEAALKEAISKERTPDNTAPKEASAKEATLKEAASREETKKEAALKEDTPKKATPKEATIKEAAPKEPSPKEAAPKEAAPQKATTANSTEPVPTPTHDTQPDESPAAPKIKKKVIVKAKNPRRASIAAVEPSKIKVEPAVVQSDALIIQRRPSDSETMVKRKKKLKLMSAVAAPSPPEAAAAKSTTTAATTSGNRREATTTATASIAEEQLATPEVKSVAAKSASAKSDQGETATRIDADPAIDGNLAPAGDRSRRASLKLAELVGETVLVVPAPHPVPVPAKAEALPPTESKEPINQETQQLQVQATPQQVAIAAADIAPQIDATLRQEESSPEQPPEKQPEAEAVEATKVEEQAPPGDSLATMPELKVLAGPVQPVKIETVEQPHDEAKSQEPLIKRKPTPHLKKLVRKNSIDKKEEAKQLSNILRDKNKINELSSRINKLTPPKKQALKPTPVQPKEEEKKELKEGLPADEEPPLEADTKEEPETEPAPETEPEPEPLPKPKKPRKIKKKVIIKRQKRRLSVSGDTFFLQPEPEEPTIPEVETIERAIAYVTDDEEEEAAPEEEPEPLKALKSCLHVREYKVGDLVLYAERYRKTQVRWKRGRVLERITSISYKLEIEGKEVPAHVSYIKKYTGRKVRFGGKEYLEIDYEQVAEEERRAASYSIWNMV